MKQVKILVTTMLCMCFLVTNLHAESQQSSEDTEFFRAPPPRLACVVKGDKSVADIANLPLKSVPIIYCTDLYHPPEDFDDHLDLATVFSMPELDVKAIILDRKGDFSGKIPVEQMFVLTGKKVPYAEGVDILKSPSDKALDQPAEYQKGVELILSTLKQNSEPMTIITAGSVRDVMAAFNREPELLRSKVLALYINIGNAEVNASQRTEYNIDIDRHAYVGLMRSNLPIYYCPCLPRKHDGATHWWMTSKLETIGHSAVKGVRNFLVYPIGHEYIKQYTQDPIAFLSVDIDPNTLNNILKRDTFNPDVMTAGKSMWCLPSLITATGRKIYRIGNDEYVAAAVAPVGGEEVKVYDFVQACFEVDERGKTTKADYKTKDSNMKAFLITEDRGLYEKAMNDCLKNLFRNFPSAK